MRLLKGPVVGAFEFPAEGNQLQFSSQVQLGFVGVGLIKGFGGLEFGESWGRVWESRKN